MFIWFKICLWKKNLQSPGAYFERLHVHIHVHVFQIIDFFLFQKRLELHTQYSELHYDIFLVLVLINHLSFKNKDIDDVLF